MEWRLFADLAERADAKHVDVDVESGATVRDALAALLSDRPDLEARVLDGDGQVQESINVLRNGEEVEDLAVTVEAGDELALFPPVSGG